MSNSEDLSSPAAYSASQTALLLLDLQGFTIKQCSDGEAVVANAKAVLDFARSNDLLIIHSIVDVNGNVPPTSKGAARLHAYVSGLKNSPEESAIHPSLKPPSSAGKNEHVFLKVPGIVSGIHDLKVRELLEREGIKSLAICGFSTSGAVLRTATPATDDGYVVTVISDGCADKTKELHEVVINQILSNRAHVSTAQEWIDSWEK